MNNMNTTNIRVYKSTHKKLKKIAEKNRQDLIVTIDRLVDEELAQKA